MIANLYIKGPSQKPSFTELTGRGPETTIEPKRGQISPTGEPQYHPTAEKLRVKKNRHRRSGSFGSTNLTPRDSPSWDRKVGKQLGLLDQTFNRLFRQQYMVRTANPTSSVKQKHKQTS